MVKYIIHRESRNDRKSNVAHLCSKLQDCNIVEALVTDFPENPQGKAIRGCCVSHLGIIKNFLKDEPIMVLEDDADFVNMPNLDNIPNNAGIILLGGETERHLKYDDNWYEILPPFFGTQCVVYYPEYKKCLLDAYELAATMNLGWGQKTICLESLLLMSLQNSDLKIYRPKTMCFSTLQTLSESTGKIEEPRRKNWIVEEVNHIRKNIV